MDGKSLLRRVTVLGTLYVLSTWPFMVAAPLAAQAICVCGAPCDRALTSTDSPSGAEVFEACNTITAGDGFAILQPAAATLRAGTSVTLNNGFSVGTDGDLTIDVQPAMTCDPLADADMDSSNACFDCDDGDDSRFPGADEICNGLDDDCDGALDEIGGCPEFIDCPTVLTPPVSGDVCEVTTVGTTGVMLRGTILAPNSVLRAGEVLVDGDGVIACVGCDCSAAPGASAAHEVSCAEGVISPGLINSHDHLSYSNNSPIDHGTERYDHRHEWRKGLNGHTELIVNSGATDAEVGAAEFRFLAGGATSTVGKGSFSGLMRNLDDPSGSEGLPVAPAQAATFPLNDADGTMLLTCNYSVARDGAADIVGVDAYLPHMAEGVGPEGHNEILCSSTGDDDLLEPQTAVVHAIAVDATDVAEMRANMTAISWSPRSNISLYGNTAPITLSHLSGVPIALGTDWIPTGSMNLLRELRCADQLNANYLGSYLTDFELWQMVTTNAARATGVERGLGLLKRGYVADIAIFDGSIRDEHRAIIDADPDDVALVMRGGEALYGDTALMSTAVMGGDTCEVISVCGQEKKACVARDTGSRVTLAQLQVAAALNYPLFFCDSPPDEPTCVPFRTGEYDGAITVSDIDGDGKDNAVDLCPTVFDPIRLMDGGSQANDDGDLYGDACDICPKDGSDSCTPPDPDDLDDDGWKNGVDNCPKDSNPGQEDADDDGHGDACDSCPTADPGVTVACVVSVEAIRNPSHPLHPAEGTLVTVEGLYVTARRPLDGLFYVQSETPGPFSGIAADTGAALLTAVPGNRVDITGLYDEYFGASTLTNAVVTVTNAGTTLPFSPIVVADPADIATGGSLAEAYESVLLRVETVTVTDVNPDAPSDYDEFEVTGQLRVDDLLYSGLNNNYPLGTPFSSITGVHGYTFSNRKLLPRGAADLVQ